MAIIKVQSAKEKEILRVTIDKTIYEQVQDYCDWLGLKKHDEFFEQAASFVLSKDRDWLKHLEQKAPKEIKEKEENF